MSVLRVVVAVGVTLALTWAALLLVLLLVRPRGINLSEAKRLVPDVLRLLRALANDASLPKGVRRRLALLLGYLALPFDVVPDFVPLLGYADDVVVVALVLRSVVRRAGPEALERHWCGSQPGLELVRSMCGLR